MSEFLQKFFSPDGFMPHGHCYLWTPGVVWLHVVSDALIAVSYYSIPLTLAWFVRRRRDIDFRWMFVCFAVFILACGTTHIMEIWNVWHGSYWVSGSIKALTAIASVPTAILLTRLMPEALKLPSPSALAKLNTALEEEVQMRRRAEEELRALNTQLESRVAARTAELRAANESLQRHIAEHEKAEERANWLATFPENNPNPIMEVDWATGTVNYANPSASREFPEVTRESLAHPALAGLREAAAHLIDGAKTIVRREIVFENRYYSQTIHCFSDPQRLRIYNSDITERKQAEEAVHQLNSELERRVKQRTNQLEAANKELEAFSYSVSHDLRAPLRAMDGFSEAVMGDCRELLPEKSQRYLQRIRSAAQQMGALIDDLLAFSRLSRLPLAKRPVDMADLVQSTLEELAPQREGRQVEIQCDNLPPCEGDPSLLKQIWVNLLSNALKYTRKREHAEIEIGCRSENGERIYFVRDNGTGFDMRYATKLFGVFQRLHRQEDYEGTGVGLAIIQRIVHRHGGRIWADARENHGATFSFTLENKTSHE